VPETKHVDELLQEMRDNGDQIVLIVDEYGGISSVVTMQELLEEIFGNIRDGSDVDDEKVVQEGDGVYVVPGSLEVSALEEKLGLTFLNDTESTTVAGAVVELFGRLPSVGEKLDHDGFQIEVLAADRRRVNRLRIKNPVTRTMTG
jgi:CBS domain containing-hemolysin-like protein